MRKNYSWAWSRQYQAKKMKTKSLTKINNYCIAFLAGATWLIVMIKLFN
jgi:hypothetical protein